LPLGFDYVASKQSVFGEWNIVVSVYGWFGTTLLYAARQFLCIYEMVDSAWKPHLSSRRAFRPVCVAPLEVEVLGEW